MREGDYASPCDFGWEGGSIWMNVWECMFIYFFVSARGGKATIGGLNMDYTAKRTLCVCEKNFMQRSKQKEVKQKFE